MTDKRYRVEIFEYATGEVSAVIGTNMTEERAEKRMETGLSRCNESFGTRMIEEDIPILKYIAVFKIYNGEATYNILVKTEAQNEKEAKEYFDKYECDTNIEIWKFEFMKEVETFEDLWGLI